jgi:signal peptidase I
MQIQPPNSPTNPTVPAKSQWRILSRRCFRWAERCFAIIGLLVVLYVLMFDLSRMVSPSMSPTLKGTSVDNGDLILTEKLSFWFRKPRRWEVITFVNDDGVRVMKRVVGLPGESVRVERDGTLLVDDVPQEIPSSVDTKYLPYGNLADNASVQCDKGYFVLGDYTRDSDDSRFNGLVAPHRITGRAWLIVGPSSRRGWVK